MRKLRRETMASEWLETRTAHVHQFDPQEVSRAKGRAVRKADEGEGTLGPPGPADAARAQVFNAATEEWTKTCTECGFQVTYERL
jgi:hypothetical protein